MKEAVAGLGALNVRNLMLLLVGFDPAGGQEASPSFEASRPPSRLASADEEIRLGPPYAPRAGLRPPVRLVARGPEHFHDGEVTLCLAGDGRLSRTLHAPSLSAAAHRALTRASCER